MRTDGPDAPKGVVLRETSRLERRAQLSPEERQLHRDLQRAIQTRPAPWTPPVSASVWLAIVVFGNGLSVLARVALGLVALAYWLSKRKIQRQYLYPEDIPDRESMLNMSLFILGWAILAVLWIRRIGWI
jgi:hypothetical protein